MAEYVYVLQITLHSPLTSAAGEGRAGVVDRDVAFDDLGLPVLPGRRLKGLWREAYRDAADAWTLCGQSPMPADRIFGASGGFAQKVAFAQKVGILHKKPIFNFK